MFTSKSKMIRGLISAVMLPSKYPKNNSAIYSDVLHFTFKNMSKREKLFIQSSNYHLPNSEENMQLLFNGGQRAPASAKKPFYSPSFPAIRSN